MGHRKFGGTFKVMAPARKLFDAKLMKYDISPVIAYLLPSSVFVDVLRLRQKCFLLFFERKKSGKKFYHYVDEAEKIAKTPDIRFSFYFLFD